MGLKMDSKQLNKVKGHIFNLIDTYEKILKELEKKPFPEREEKRIQKTVFSNCTLTRTEKRWVIYRTDGFPRGKFSNIDAEHDLANLVRAFLVLYDL